MKKAKTPPRDELRREYKRSDFPGGLVRGKQVAGVAGGASIVRLDPDIAAAFPTSKAVNVALGKVLRVAKPAAVTKRPTGRAKDKRPD